MITGKPFTKNEPFTIAQDQERHAGQHVSRLESQVEPISLYTIETTGYQVKMNLASV